MSKTFIDTNIFLRFLEGHEASKRFVDGVKNGKKSHYVPSLVVAELYWVLANSYHLEKDKVVECIKSILAIRNVRLSYPHDLILAIELHQNKNVKFNDCVISTYLKDGDILVSFDKEFDRLSGVVRIEPS